MSHHHGSRATSPGPYERVSKVVALASFLIIVIGIVWLPGASADRATAVPARTFCFNAADWGPASDAVRPCVKIRTLYEDGSARIVQTDAGGHYAVACVLQNPREVRVRGSYVTRCRRLR